MTCACHAHQAVMEAALADGRAALDEGRWFLRWYGGASAGLLVAAFVWGHDLSRLVLATGSVGVTWWMGRSGADAHRRARAAGAQFDAATRAIEGCPVHGPAMAVAKAAPSEAR